MPAIITNYDTDTKRASVQILTRRKHVSGDVNVPQLLDLPVHQPFAGSLFLGFEPKTGDECLVIFAEREVESAKETGEVYELRYSRMHDIIDGFVIPFCFSNDSAQSVTNGVSLIECFLELAEIVRATAVAVPSPGQAAQAQALITKLENVL